MTPEEPETKVILDYSFQMDLAAIRYKWPDGWCVMIPVPGEKVEQEEVWVEWVTECGWHLLHDTEYGEPTITDPLLLEHSRTLAEQVRQSHLRLAAAAEAMNRTVILSAEESSQ